MAVNTLSPPQHAVSAEQRRDNMTERIWQGSDMLLRNSMNRAMSDIARKGERPTPSHAIELARNRQRSLLEDKDTTDNWTISERASNQLAYLVMCLPSATRVQNRIDTHASRDRAADVATLSRFNRDIATTIAVMPGQMLDDLPNRLYLRGRNVLEGKLGLESMDERNINLTLAGAKREAAMLRAITETIPEDWQVRQPGTRDDMLGADLIVINDKGQELRMDVKSRNAFDHEVDSLERDRWIPSTEAERARGSGFLYRRSRAGDGAEVFNCVVDADMFGEIDQYEYKDPFNVYEFVERQFQEQGQTRLRKLGKHAINI